MIKSPITTVYYCISVVFAIPDNIIVREIRMARNGLVVVGIATIDVVHEVEEYPKGWWGVRLIVKVVKLMLICISYCHRRQQGIKHEI